MLKTKVILDTNALLLFGQRGFDLFAEIDRALDEKYELLLPEPVLDELEKLALKKTKDGMAAKLGFSLAQEKLRRSKEDFLSKLLVPTKEIPLKTVPCSGTKHADDAIMRIAEDDAKRSIVVTLDKGLQRRLLKSKIRVLSVKQQGLGFIG